MIAPGEASIRARYRQALAAPQAAAIAAIASRFMGQAGGTGLRSGCSLAHDVGEQTEKPRPLDRPRQLALLLRRHRGDAARHDLAALGDEALQQANLLVIDLRRV